MDGTISPQLEEKIDEIRGHLEKARADGWSLNEADTERVVIFPLLTALGYGPLDIRQRGHDSVANNFPDYTLLPGTPQKWFLEVKKLDLSLQDGEAAQAVNYANNQGAEWAVLTNGRKWYIYNAHLPKPLTEKRVFQIDDLFGDVTALKTLAFLSRSSMLKDGLTQAWTFERVQSIVKAQLETPHSAVRKRLRQIITDEIKHSVTDALLEQTLRSLYITASATSINHIAPVPKPVHSAQAFLSGNPAAFYTFAEIAANSTLGTGKKPRSLIFDDGSIHNVKGWAEVGPIVLNKIDEKFSMPPLPFAGRTRGGTYFINRQPTHSATHPMISPYPVQTRNGTVYMELKRSTEDLARCLVVLFTTVGVPADFVKVSIAMQDK